MAIKSFMVTGNPNDQRPVMKQTSEPVFAKSVANAIGTHAADNEEMAIRPPRIVVGEAVDWKLRDRRLLYIAGLTFAAALVAAGAGLTLQVLTQPEPETPRVDRPVAEFMQGLE